MTNSIFLSDINSIESSCNVCCSIISFYWNYSAEIINTLLPIVSLLALYLINKKTKDIFFKQNMIFNIVFYSFLFFVYYVLLLLNNFIAFVIFFPIYYLSFIYFKYYLLKTKFWLDKKFITFAFKDVLRSIFIFIVYFVLIF